MAKKKDKQGFTLVEVLVCLAIVGITGIFLAGFLSPQVRVYNLSTEQSRAKTVCDATFNIIQQKVRYGKDFTLAGNVLTYTEVTETGEIPNQQINGDTLGNELYPDYPQEAKEVITSFAINGAVLQVTVTVRQQSDSKEIYQLSQKINCLNEEIALTQSEEGDG